MRLAGAGTKTGPSRSDITGRAIATKASHFLRNLASWQERTQVRVGRGGGHA